MMVFSLTNVTNQTNLTFIYTCEKMEVIGNFHINEIGDTTSVNMTTQ